MVFVSFLLEIIFFMELMFLRRQGCLFLFFQCSLGRTQRISSWQSANNQGETEYKGFNSSFGSFILFLCYASTSYIIQKLLFLMLLNSTRFFYTFYSRENEDIKSHQSNSSVYSTSSNEDEKDDGVNEGKSGAHTAPKKMRFHLFHRTKHSPQQSSSVYFLNVLTFIICDWHIRFCFSPLQ